jgi:hypothetical protein
VSEIDPDVSRLYREASGEQPPAALDASILAAARKHLEKRRSRGLSSWWRWMAPASAIATLALGVSLALLIERERPEPTGDTAPRRVPPPAPSAPPGRAAESAKTRAADGGAPAVAKKEKPSASAPSPTPAPTAEQAYTAERRAKTAAPAAAPPKAAMESNVAADSALGSAEVAAPARPPAAGRVAPLAQEALRHSPEAWLEEIGRLKRAGRGREAAEQLAEFRRAYPEHAIPESLAPK